MNKAELVNAMALKAGLSKMDSKKALEGFVSSISEALASGNKVSLVGFGSFFVVQRAERRGINPSTKKTILIPAKKSAKFKVGNELAQAVK